MRKFNKFETVYSKAKAFNKDNRNALFLQAFISELVNPYEHETKESVFKSYLWNLQQLEYRNCEGKEINVKDFYRDVYMALTESTSV